MRQITTLKPAHNRVGYIFIQGINPFEDISCMQKHLFIFFLIALGIEGCDTNSGIVPTSQDTFMVSRQAATGLTGIETLNAEATKDANEYCTSKNKNLLVTDAIVSSPAYIMNRYTLVEIHFTCTEKLNDTELSSTAQARRLY